MSSKNDKDTEYILSGRSGKIKKRIKVRVRKKKNKFSRISPRKILTHPLMIAFYILIVAAIVFFSLPKSNDAARKWKLRADEKTKEINKTIKETDSYK